MYLRLTAEQEQFRSDVCELLCTESVQAEAAAARRLPPDSEPGLLQVYRRLGERGWLAVNWPIEYGGAGKTIVEKCLLTEELIRHGIPDIIHTLSIDIVGLALHLFGTKEQRQRWLPPLAHGESAACVLFSEPESGSDLSSLRTKAEPDGDGWRLRGRKVYSAKSHLADFALCAARTTDSEVRQHGITVFLVPMRTPGVVVTPLWSMSQERYGDVTLAGLRLTRDDVLGEVDDGWHVIGRVLDLERTGIEFEAKGRRLLDAILTHAARTGRLDESGVGSRLVELDAELRATRLLAWRAVSLLRDGKSDNVLSAMAKWHSTETTKAAAMAALDTCGLAAALHARDGEAVADGLVESTYRDAPGITLASGTSEVMLSVIASAGLGLLG